ncbi:MAG: 2-polyprenylphenol 6-hydroxylase [Chitinophagales bacterium]|nr:2-polyprenylphenol 6-hydroxylase [Hyphomicrobiales bacterium]
MANAITNIYRLARAGLTLGWHGVGFIPQSADAPALVRGFGRVTSPWRRTVANDKSTRLSTALVRLGPTYIKLGQFLATRPDVIGPALARDLSGLQDRLPPFSMPEARTAVKAELGAPVETLFAEFGPPIAAASIAQVHKAAVREADGSLRAVAVKILRPDVEARFARDLDSFFFAASAAEKLNAPIRRLRPVAAVQTLADSTALEMDLRMEAAAISEIAENIANAGDEGFRVPKVDWARTAKRVLTIEWVDGIPLSNLAAIDAAGFDRENLGNLVIRSFLRHAMRDGFFHADLHQGNLFAERDGSGLVAVDFGIMGRLGPQEKRFLAEILYGFITRQYRRIAEVHFEAGYVPATQNIDAFAQALRSIGEPLVGRPAHEISMARVLTQLFEVTDLFGMKTRPELLLLQKTMVVTEGVARTLDPRINIWTASEPIVRAWVADQIGPRARIARAAEVATALTGLAADAPKIAREISRAATAFTDFANESAAAKTRGGTLMLRTAFLIAALSLAAIAFKLWA